MCVSCNTICIISCSRCFFLDKIWEKLCSSPANSMEVDGAEEDSTAEELGALVKECKFNMKLNMADSAWKQVLHHPVFIQRITKALLACLYQTHVVSMWRCREFYWCTLGPAQHNLFMSSSPTKLIVCAIDFYGTLQIFSFFFFFFLPPPFMIITPEQLLRGDQAVERASQGGEDWERSATALGAQLQSFQPAEEPEPGAHWTD